MEARDEMGDVRPPLTRRELDHMKCGNPACADTHGSEMYLHAGCHVRAGLTVHYEDGVLTITCRLCKRGVARVAVAEGVKPS